MYCNNPRYGPNPESRYAYGYYDRPYGFGSNAYPYVGYGYGKRSVEPADAPTADAAASADASSAAEVANALEACKLHPNDRARRLNFCESSSVKMKRFVSRRSTKYGLHDSNHCLMSQYV